MKDLYEAFKYLARRFHGRWAAIDDALTLIRSSSGARTADGERTRRMLMNAFRNQTYTYTVRDALQTDRVNALRGLGKPLSEALGHIITIELSEEMLKAVDEAEKRRWHERSTAEAVERRDTVYGPMIRCLNAHGIVRGHHEVITDNEWTVVARYLRRKVEQRMGPLPPIRSDRETRGPEGRRHPFWNPYKMPRADHPDLE